MSDLCLFIYWDFDPTIFTVSISDFKFPVPWYGLCFALAFIFGQQVLMSIFKIEGKPKEDVELITMYVVLGTIIGARLGHFLFYEWQSLFNEPWQWFTEMITPPFAGLASHGATIGILFSIYLYTLKRKDQKFLWVVDRIVITICFAGLIRLGNLFNSEIYGKQTNLPWGFVFLRETDAAFLPLVPRHPTQIYEALFCGILFFVTYFLWKYKRNVMPSGVITSVFMIALFSFRFFIEFLKNNQNEFEEGMKLNMGQILSIPVVLTGGLILIYIKYFKNQIKLF